MTEIGRNQWLKNASDAMEGLVGVNDQLDFSDIVKIIKLGKHAFEASYFKEQIEKNRDLLEAGTGDTKEIEEELQHVTNCACFWEGEFITELKNIENSDTVVKNALWELENLIRIASKTLNNVKYYYDWYNLEKSFGRDF